MTTNYSLTAEGPAGDHVPILRSAFVVWRISTRGEIELRGIFATGEDARADVTIASGTPGWRVAQAPLIGWEALALRGER